MTYLNIKKKAASLHFGLKKRKAPARRDRHKSIQQRGALCHIAGLLMTRAAGAWSLDNTLG
jgi:hypothetical protein